jgi:CRISPR-associated protein Csm1
MNAAGKFVIVAPNTTSSRQKVKALSKEFDQWFLSRQYAQISVGIATLEVTSQDFEQKNFGNLQERIHKSLGLAKMQKFNLCSCNGGIIKQFEEHYITDKGVCCFDGRLPAQAEADDEGNYSCLECLDILRIGEKLTKEHLISLDFTPFEDGLKTDILGIYIGWKKEADILRLWDISLPKDFDTPLFNGQARRYINAYVPRFTEADTSNVVYQGLDEPQPGALKTFSHLARENCQVIDGNLTVKPGLMILKGDIDNLGALFASVEKPTFATLAQLSRQLNNFFSVFLPYFCRTEKVAQNIYTIFAGGDDFYLIAPWLDGMNIVPIFKQKFKEYVANQDITFSLGMSMTKSGEDVLSQSNFVEQSLTQAKSYRNPINGAEKNAVCCFGQTVSFEEYNELLNLQNELDLFKQKYGLSIGYIYSLQKFCEQANRLSNSVNINEALNDALWRSRLVYKTVRFIENSSVSEENKTQAVNEICTHLGNAISKYKMHYIITLYSWLYQQREAQ